MSLQPNDTYLVARVAVMHDKKAFDALVCKYQSRLRRFFLSQTLGDSQLSDDLAQDTFVKAYVGISGFRGMSSFSTWLFRIAWRVLYDYGRTHRPTADIDGCAAMAARGIEPDGALGMDVYEALARMKPAERACVTLQLIDGQTVDKIASITGMPANTVKSHLKRGKDRLADYLRQNGYDK